VHDLRFNRVDSADTEPLVNQAKIARKYDQSVRKMSALKCTKINQDLLRKIEKETASEVHLQQVFNLDGI